MPKKHIAPHHKEPVAALTVGVLLFALLCLFVLGSVATKELLSLDNDDAHTISKTTTSDAPTPSKLDVLVNKTSYSDGSEGFTPLDGQHYVIVNVSVTHRLEKATWLTPFLQSYIKDSAGETYNMSPVAIDKPFDAREYKPDETATGDLSYMVPRSAKKLSWCYEIQEQKFNSCVTIE